MRWHNDTLEKINNVINKFDLSDKIKLKYDLDKYYELEYPGKESDIWTLAIMDHQDNFIAAMDINGCMCGFDYVDKHIIPKQIADKYGFKEIPKYDYEDNCEYMIATELDYKILNLDDHHQDAYLDYFEWFFKELKEIL